MTTRTFSQASLDFLDAFPPAKRGPGFRTVSVVSYSSSSSDESVEVPEDLNSLQFLLFIGFSEDVAQVIWQGWQNRGSRNDWVVDAARHYIKHKARDQDATDATDDWDGALRHMGLSDDLRRRILNPAYDSIRLTQCACYWALDTVNEAFDFLTSLTKRLDKKRAEISRTDSPDESKKPRPASRGRGQSRNIGSSSSSRDVSMPTVQAATPPPHIDGRTYFFKGGAEFRLEQCIGQDGNILMAAIHSSAPTDFHPEKSTYVYLTKYHEVALLYARYAEERVPPSKAAILHITISDDLTANSREIFGDHWRDLIWNSRNTEVHLTTYKQLPYHLRTYEEAEILIGQICHDSTHKIARMSNKNELSVMKLPSGGRASQLVLQSIPLQISMARDLKGFVWIVPTDNGAKR